jgi:hypothetical protein
MKIEFNTKVIETVEVGDVIVTNEDSYLISHYCGKKFITRLSDFTTYDDCKANANNDPLKYLESEKLIRIIRSNKLMIREIG